MEEHRAPSPHQRHTPLHELRAMLDDVAAGILGAAGGDTDRAILLRGAALLTGRADLAQEASHGGLGHAVLVGGGAAPSWVEQCHDVLHQVRTLRRAHGPD